MKAINTMILIGIHGGAHFLHDDLIELEADHETFEDEGQAGNSLFDLSIETADIADSIPEAPPGGRISRPILPGPGKPRPRPGKPRPRPRPVKPNPQV